MTRSLLVLVAACGGSSSSSHNPDASSTTHDAAVGTPFPDQPSHVTRQAKVLHDGAIKMHYCQRAGNQSAQADEQGMNGSIGIESPDGTKGLSAGFHTAAAHTDAAYRFTPM